LINSREVYDPLFFCCLTISIAQAHLFLLLSAPAFHNSRSSVFPSTPSIVVFVPVVQVKTQIHRVAFSPSFFLRPPLAVLSRDWRLNTGFLMHPHRCKLLCSGSSAVPLFASDFHDSGSQIRI
jgi:hypothetical protein